jgi:hypothetical protein
MKLQYDAFTSNSCKSQDHDRCAGYWTGLEIEVICQCDCHKYRNSKRDEVTEPVSLMLGTTTSEGCKEDV